MNVGRIACRVILGFTTAAAVAQVPFLTQTAPVSAAPGNKSFTLTVTGTGFATGAVVNWNGSPRATKLVSSSRLQATIKASDVASAKTASITVSNPQPAGGTSNVIFFPVTVPTSAIAMAISNPFPGATAVVVGDFNNDGKLDVAWANANGSGGINVSLGNGQGGLQSAININALPTLFQMLTGDFNGDGKLDIAAIYHGEILILLGNGDGTFTTSFLTTVGDFTISSAAVADFNGDGRLDVYVGGLETGPYGFNIYTGNGDGTLTFNAFYYTGTSPSIGFIPEIPAVGDFNGDGYLDLVIAGSNGNGQNSGSVWLGSASGIFTESTTQLNAIGSNLVAADLNHDGKLDVVGDGGCVMLGTGTGNFGPCTYLTSSDAVDGIADFNGDGKLDIANDSVAVELGTGSGAFPTVFSFGKGALPPGAIGDFNNDGRLDVVSSNGNLFLRQR